MDENQKAGSQAGGGVCNLLINGFLAYYFYQYAYVIDEGKCWAADYTQVPSATGAGGYTDVSANFNSWFTWGFYINIVALVVGVLQIIAGAAKSEALA